MLMDSIFVLMFILICATDSTLIKWRWNSKVDEKSIGIKNEFLMGMGNKNASATYRNKIAAMKKFSLDEKCETGQDLGVGYQIYTPYVDIGIGGGDMMVISGIVPHIVKEITKICCAKSSFAYGHFFKSILEIEEHFESDAAIDFSFPVYGLDGPKSRQYKDFPFVPVVTAPKIILLVPDRLYQERNTRTRVLMRTIFNSWPMLGFIVVSACLAGLTVWLLDKEHNATEFPPTFFSGAWEGIWWAFVTMTTVGYGDRSPKSGYARAFCIIWILMGIIIISLFTGLVSAALSASATPVFNIAGAKIGAVRGSIEFQVGVGLNADMTAYENHATLVTSLLNEKNLHGVLIDNFILSASQGMLQQTKLRIEREIDHPVTYGVVMRHNSTKTEECVRRYISHNPQKIFETISEYLRPVRNPTDEVRLEVAAAEKLFYEERVFKTVVYTETGLLIVSLMVGVIWEVFVRNKQSAAYRIIGRLRKKPEFADAFYLNSQSGFSSKTPETESKSCELESLIGEYNEFHVRWVNRVRSVMKGRKNNDDVSSG